MKPIVTIKKTVLKCPIPRNILSLSPKKILQTVSSSLCKKLNLITKSHKKMKQFLRNTLI